MDGKVLSHVRGAVSSHRSFVSGDRSGSKLKANVLLAAIYPLTNCPNDFSLIDVVLSFLSTSCAHKIMEAKSQITAVRREIKLFFFFRKRRCQTDYFIFKACVGGGRRVLIQKIFPINFFFFSECVWSGEKSL